ncbi:hypothetical protein PGTUg99_014519 [Puccinia graminis f. sp. tritici]|uniref:Uncharacterized protein n=1 Tax=Puccinia graminis f. sp. tritici TaxID=56615 RepID=A0A5B0Q3U8_PUCGR|nr:hypothetical protein PGTUg99_014519 [Puccinia graminis f. sp. tritici]
MAENNKVEDFFSKILSISKSASRIPEATRNNLIYQRFSYPPIIAEDEEDEGMWYVVNQAMDSLFGVNNCKENLRTGQFGIEVVLNYLKKAHAGGVITEEIPEKPSPKKFNKFFSDVVNKTSNASKATAGLSKSTACTSKKTSSLPKSNSSVSRQISTTTPKNPKPTSSSLNLSGAKIDKKVLLKCPKSTKEQVCKSCSISKYEDGDSHLDTVFKCHCGASPVVLPKGRSQNVEAHWESRACKQATSSVMNTRPLTSYFNLKRTRSNLDPQEPAPKPKKKTVSLLCSGLNDNTWPRPRQQFSIHQCIVGSPSAHHRAPPRHKVCFELFGTTKESELSEEQSRQLVQTLESKSVWFIKRHDATAGIFSSNCERHVNVAPGTVTFVCNQCLLLKNNNSLKKALNVKYASADNVKDISPFLMKQDLFQSKLLLYGELRQLNTSLEKHSRTGDQEFWSALAIHAKRGFFKENDAFQGLVKAVAVRTEREAAGKALSGMKFDIYFNNFLTTMAAMSPAAAKFLRDNMGGRSLRSMRNERKKNGGQIEDGIVLTNFERVAGYVASLGYTGPLALASDQTVCVKSLRSHNGHLVGAQGGDVPFSSLEELAELVKKSPIKMNFAVRLYTIQVPLPKVPSFVVALVASYDKEKAEDIAASHIAVLDYCSQAGMSIVSIGSDGAATEISALRILQTSVDQYLCFQKADAGILVQVPLMGQSLRPVVPVQDPKHARKTAANQLLSGAWLLSFGKYYLNISHLVEILNKSSPLYSRDVLNCDKQDDGRAYRTMNWETLEASLQSPTHTGLSIYLFLFGELTDSWLCSNMIHLDRI